ncbi:MAG: radical SAM protein [Deltaproteobacteria bacterium]|nr:radical SAM protein [Deltaproteobacteria bacterium]
MVDLTPTSNQAEIHLTYRCNLRCKCCNRCAFLDPPHTPDITRADILDFFAQARVLKWQPKILIIGGEPTLHPQFEELVRVCAAESVHRVVVWSNGYARATKRALARISTVADVFEETFKQKGSVVHEQQDVYCAPVDLGVSRPICGQHASRTCGISVDALGFTPCCMGGAIDGVLGLGARTRVLADLWDADKVAKQTRRLCDHCGHLLSQLAPLLRLRMATFERRHGGCASPTWARAFDAWEGAPGRQGAKRRSGRTARR